LTPLVLKFGGELLEDPERLQSVVTAVRSMAAVTPLAIVHGGGREIDAALTAARIEKRQVEGLRITDAATLKVVVAVLAGTINTRFVAQLTSAGVAAVGLTGADGACGLSEAAPPHRTMDGRLVDLGCVGIPTTGADIGVVQTLIDAGFVPVIASIGIGADGRLFNVNADTFASHVATRLSARRLVIAGTTAGVLGPDGATVPLADRATIARLMADGTVTAGMMAKLRASQDALDSGVDDVVIVDGRDSPALVMTAVDEVPIAATRLVTRDLARGADHLRQGYGGPP
jgi:acetylglutamate kinase